MQSLPHQSSRLNPETSSLATCRISKSIDMAFRAPKRITITIPYSLYAFLVTGSAEQGRSLSNYAAHLLESGATLQVGSAAMHDTPVLAEKGS